jgi:hypothetical protein
MNPATLQDVTRSRPDFVLASSNAGKLVSASEFRNLLVSHRRMVRSDYRSELLRGLRDLDTGEIFLIDERRLLHA